MVCGLSSFRCLNACIQIFDRLEAEEVIKDLAHPSRLETKPSFGVAYHIASCVKV